MSALVSGLVPVTGADVLRVAGLNRRSTRLAAAEALAASEGGPITERALRDLRAAQAVEHRHLGSDTVGEAVFLDTMYIGNLKGVGKIWQYTAVDGACSSASPAPGPERSPRRRWPISPNMTSGPPKGRSASSSSRS
jgi:hypothetical protein